ncbi:methylenetetrahydrofolate reductase [NAD(P)H] [Nitratidesulfovibrio sp. SRB-5]|uniref:methylenetetrahydrofolate reductase [NAD(P)H] n=1 Tax=Nitratidesulfovibrio sp. SRB-5 TaxID=2872636 RepID=UPI0010272C50|nr:methylenetetrahydrofolate reductase [NAD(P)H] [Nitratidesulfovibrio sp. SRB-5]MBZ2171209.1 methylenetetrahydrofolate reductase [NAD(P)H] [Nitratidesulfovibrio sp. SRB-5]RXF76669.1 methylenetetrahydrofolate reductase [NAD(P)H] [Desulfovibrio sp. DS-1]
MKIRDRIAASTRPFYSLEFFPPKERENWPGFFATVERLKALNPLFASVTYGAGGSTQDNTLEITSHLKNVMGLEPMAHLTCVGATRERIADYLRRLREVNVDNVLALRGDAPKGQDIDWGTAEFRYAADLVRFTRNEQPEMGVGVAGYPAAHPESPSFASDLRHTADKVNAGADFIVTQLFFDVREYFDFVERLRAMGVTVPVLPGILPIQSLESVRRILSLCGANIPGKLYLELDAANEKGGAEAVKEAGIAFAQQQIRSLLDGGAPGIHLYTLNRADTCLRIAEAVGMR